MLALGDFLMGESWYDTAQICLNGHVNNRMTQMFPERDAKFCRECGAPTMTNCQSCNAPIRGEYHVPGVVVVGSSWSPPSYCHECGEPYPWVRSKLEAARELVDELEDLNTDEREKLRESLDDLVRDTPGTNVAAMRFKRIVAKCGSGVAEAFKEILVDVMSETAKKTIYGP
jgi:hypothetical protein